MKILLIAKRLQRYNLKRIFGCGKFPQPLFFVLNIYDDNITTLQSNFQAGVSSVYDAIVAKGVTPASTSLSDIITGIGNIETEFIMKINKTVTNISFGGDGPNYNKLFTITSNCDIWIICRITRSVMRTGEIYINDILSIRVEYGGTTTGFIGKNCKKGNNTVRVKYSGGSNSSISGNVEVLYPDTGNVTIT